MNDNDPVQLLGDAVARLEDNLLENALSPDPERRNWAAFRRELDDLESASQAVIARLGPAWLYADRDLRSAIASKSAATLRDAAIVLQLAGRESSARPLLDRAADLARDGGAKDVLRSLDQLSQRPELAAGECYHRWLQATGRLSLPPPRRSIPPRRSMPPKDEGDIEVPVSSAPSLIRINGCGVGLYGCEDTKPDGSYLSAYCVSLLWLPVFPICWYRVVDAERGYLFVARRPLGLKGRLWQLATAACAMAAILVFAKVGNPFTGQAAARAELDRLAASESEGTVAKEELLDRYLSIAQEHSNAPEGRIAATKAAGLLSTRIPLPCKSESVDEVRRQALRISPVPADIRSGKSEQILRDALVRCARQLPSESLEEIEVLGVAIAISTDPKEIKALAERRSDSIAAVAARVRDREPLHAIALYRTILPQSKGMEGMLQVFDSLPAASFLVASAEPAMQAWLGHAASDSHWQTRAAAVRQRLSTASADSAAWRLRLDNASDAELEQLFKDSAGVEEVAVAYARMRRSAGEPSQGIEAITHVEAQGRLTYDSRMELAACYRDARKLDEARTALRAVIQDLSLPYQEAIERWRSARTAARERLVEQARRERKLAKDADLPEDALEAIEKALSEDAQLKGLAGEVDGPSVAVRAAVALASIDLAEGMAAEGDERARLLQDAETTLLRMKVAEGDFDYDLQAGVVLHRVGKTAQAEAAFTRAMQGADSNQLLKVANAYRGIGMRKKAQQLTESAWRTASEDSAKWDAAAARAVLWDSLEDRKVWLDRCEPQSSRLDRMQVDSELALQRGEEDEAAKLMAQVCKEYEPRIGNDAADSNNAGIAFLRLHEMTGDPEPLQKAVRALSKAAALGPDRPVVLDNYADALELIGSQEVLQTWVHVRALRLDSPMTRDALEILADSKLSDSVLDAMRANRSLRLSLQAREQYGVLAPHDRAALYGRISRAEMMGSKRLLDTALSQLQQLTPEEPAANAQAPSAPAASSAASAASANRSDGGAPAKVDEDSDERRALERARKDGHAPTISLASLMLAAHLRSVNRTEQDPAIAAEMAQLAQQAIKGWPELRTTDAAVFALIESALITQMQRAPAIREAWRSESSTTVWLHDVLGSKDAQQVRDALRGDKHFVAAVESVKSLKKGGGVLGWELARVIGDAEWKRRAAASIDERDYRVNEAYARMTPGGGSARFLEIVREVRGADNRE